MTRKRAPMADRVTSTEAAEQRRCTCEGCGSCRGVPCYPCGVAGSAWVTGVCAYCTQTRLRTQYRSGARR